MILNKSFTGNQAGQTLLPYFANLPENIPLIRPTLRALTQAEPALPDFVKHYHHQSAGLATD